MSNVKSSKNSIRKIKFYNTLLRTLKVSTNLTDLQEKLNVSKQNLNYHLRKLCIRGIISRKGNGWYEVKKQHEISKNSIQYGSDFAQDLTRGHAYIWKAKITKTPSGWEKRIEILKKAKINYKLVGAMKNIPRIKVYGRKVWLCNSFVKIWETRKNSFYGNDEVESQEKAYDSIMIVIQAIENKLGLNLRPYAIKVTREHYALIKNDLAKYHNEKGEVVRISDKNGEWLLIDDSLEMGGELENIGKKSFKTHGQMKPWWNSFKKHKFKHDADWIDNKFNTAGDKMVQMTNVIGSVVGVQEMHSHNIVKHQKVLDEMLITLKLIQEDLRENKGL